MFFYDNPSKHSHLVGQTNFCDFPPLNNENILISDNHFRNPERKGVYKRYLSLEGQCRFLDFGYYFGEGKLQVDKVFNFRNIPTELNEYFKENNIDVFISKEEYESRSLNTQFRKATNRWNISPLPKTNWWYEGEQGKDLEKLIEKRFGFLNNIVKF